MNPYEVLIKPVLSEKSNLVREELSVYTFQVHMNANKVDVSRAMSKLFDVKVDSVRLMRTHGRTRRRGITVYKEPSTKKALIKLAEGQKLKMFEEQ